MIYFLPYLLAIGADTTAHPTLEEALQAGRIGWEACSRECRVQVRDLERGKTYTDPRDPRGDFPPHPPHPRGHTMTRKELLARIADELGHESGDVTLEARIVEDLWWDSLDLVEVALVLEEVLDVSLTDEEVHSCQTVGDLLAISLAVAARIEG